MKNFIEKIYKINFDKNRIDKIIFVLSFFLIFIYYLNFPNDSAKFNLVLRGSEGILHKQFGLWGLINDYLYKFFYYIFKGFKFFDNGINFIEDYDAPGNQILYLNSIVMQSIFAFQLSIVWSLVIYKLTRYLKYYTFFIFFHPFLLNYLALCTRDALAIGIFLLIGFYSWNYIKILLSLSIAYFFHMALIPMIFVNILVDKFKNNSQKIFLFFTLISLFICLTLFYLLRYTDIALLIPLDLYGEVLIYPRRGFTGIEGAERLLLNKVNLVFNYYGDIKLKILFFGVTGQLITILFKNKLSKNIFSYCFTVFFICAAFNSLPNSNRFIYHALIIGAPFLIDVTLIDLKNKIKKLKI